MQLLLPTVAHTCNITLSGGGGSHGVRGFQIAVCWLMKAVALEELRGSGSQVLCIDWNEDLKGLVSGEESGGCVRFWDAVRAPRVESTLLYEGKGSVGSVCFLDERYVLAGVDEKLICIDRRNPVVEVASWSRADSICQISKRGSQVAVCDDSGALGLIRLNDENQFRDAEVKEIGSHDNICSGCLFLEDGEDSTEFATLASCGLDCQINIWEVDCTNSEHDEFPGDKVHISRKFDLSASNSTSTAGPTINPPFVYSIDANEDGEILIAGLGSGDIRVIYLEENGESDSETGEDTRNQNLVDKCSFEIAGHGEMVSSVRFAKWPNAIDHGMFLSAASDKRLVLWSLNKGFHSDAKVSDFRKWMTYEIAHEGGKPNWLCSTTEGSVFLADTSSVISRYIFQS